MYYVAVEEDSEWYWVATFNSKMDAWHYASKHSKGNSVCCVFFWKEWWQEITYYRNGERRNWL